VRVFLLLLLFVLLTACGGPDAGEADAPPGDEAAAEQPEAAQAEDDEDDKPARERSTSVTVAEVMRRDLVVPVNAEGSIRARHVADVTFETTGRIEKVWVTEGQRVRKGQTLVSLDDRELQLALEEATSRYLTGLARLVVEEDGYEGGERAERILEKQTEELVRREEKGEITRRERLDRQLELGMSAVRDGAYRRELIEVRSGLASARADVERLEIELERTVLEAPFSGVVSDMQLDPGEHVMTGQKALRLVDDVHLEAAVGVLESDLAAVAEGKPALLEIPALGETLPLTIDVLDPEVAAGSRTCQALLRLESPDQRIKPGMFVRAAIAGQVFGERIVVPREAIVSRDGRPVLFKVEDDRAKWVYVQLGPQNDKLVEIARVDQGGPLDPGTPVIVDNHLTMTHDAKVKVKDTVAVPDPWAPPPID
jgi:RND family efflux transporter MFP subunit